MHFQYVLLLILPAENSVSFFQKACIFIVRLRIVTKHTYIFQTYIWTPRLFALRVYGNISLQSYSLNDIIAISQ
jgi:hypothetical protein